MTRFEADGIVELMDSELDDVQGGIGLLLPAVQKVREAAARMSCLTAEDTTVMTAAG